MKNRLVAGLTIFSFLIGSAGTYGWLEWKNQEEEQQREQETIQYKDLDKVSKAFELIQSNYVEEVEEKDLIEGAIQGMLATLEDPYSVYMDEEMVKQFNETLESSFEGIGAEISKVNGKVIIVAPLKDSPAEKAGLKPNDEIVSVDGEKVEGLDLYETTLKIRGEKGTKVKLEIKRQGVTEPITVEVLRDEIPQITVNGDIKKQADKQIGYIEITSFSEETAKEFKKKLKEMEKEGIDGLLIDVRGNPGGLLSSVEEIVKEFVTKEKPYVQIEKRDGEKMRYFSSLKKGKDYPVAVLINGGSASASEILAGALREGGGYPLIGEKTFGKGTVQQAVPMGDGSNIKLTLFKWLTPDGNWIHKKGLKPDIEVSQPPIYHTHPLHLEEVLEKDMNNEQVKHAQQILKGLGFEPGREDGYFDDGTEKAVKAFQTFAGLAKTGKVDEKTASAMENAVIEEMKKVKNDLQLQTALRYLAR